MNRSKYWIYRKLIWRYWHRWKDLECWNKRHRTFPMLIWTSIIKSLSSMQLCANTSHTQYIFLTHRKSNTFIHICHTWSNCCKSTQNLFNFQLVHLLFSWICQLILSPAIIAFLYTRVGPQRFNCININFVKCGNRFVINLFDKLTVFLWKANTFSQSSVTSETYTLQQLFYY